MWADGGETIASSGRHVILLEPCHVLAKVAPGDRLGRFTVEVEVCRHVQRRRGPVVPPLLRGDPGPHEEGGFVVSLWEHLPSEVSGEDLEAEAVAAYVELLPHLQDYSGALPWFTEPAVACRESVARRALSSLPPERVRLVEHELAAIESIGVPESTVRVLHGDPHARNLTRSWGETLWLDLKAACRGPIEWDLTALPARGRFEPPDPELFARLQRLRSACVVVWCLTKASPSAHDRRAIAHHLERLETF